MWAHNDFLVKERWKYFGVMKKIYTFTIVILKTTFEALKFNTLKEEKNDFPVIGKSFYYFIGFLVRLRMKYL